MDGGRRRDWKGSYKIRFMAGEGGGGSLGDRGGEVFVEVEGVQEGFSIFLCCTLCQ